MEIGKVREFTIISAHNSGHYIRLLSDDNEIQDDIFMPLLRNNTAPSRELSINQIIDAFVYRNDQGEIQASVLLPQAEVGEFAILRVVDTQDFGAFLD